MKQLAILPICILIAVFPSNTLDSVDRPSDHWDCYEAKPGHPTNEEKKIFLDRILPFADAAEAHFGTPAAGLIGIAMQESGYGWTRTALYANNYFGFKFTSTEASGGRPSWTLGCQPANDPNSKYIKFTSLEDSVAFVARKLALSQRYKGATETFKKAKQDKSLKPNAVNAWIEDIARMGYNPDPLYPKRIEMIMRNYVTPSDVISPTLNLYRLSQQKQTTR